MKNKLCLFFLIFVFHTSWTQSTMENPNELGFNVNVLLNQVFFDNQPSQSGIPVFVPSGQFTSITYRYYSNPSLAFRSGIGFFQKEVIDSTSSGFFFVSDFDKIKYLGFNIGLQRRINISKVLKPYIGLDLIYQNIKTTNEHFEESTGGFDWRYKTQNINKTNSYGLGIPIGIQIFITKQISISTESNLEFMFSDTKTTFKDLLGQSGENVSNVDNTTVEWKLPLSVFVNYSF